MSSSEGDQTGGLNLKLTQSFNRNPEWIKYPCKQEMDDYLWCLGDNKLEGLKNCVALAKIHKECKDKHDIPRTNQIR